MKRSIFAMLFGLFVFLSPVTSAPLFAQNATPAATIAPQQTAQVLRGANLRSGPGTTYAIVGAAKAGQQVIITGKNAKGDWYQLKDGKWIAGSLVKIGAGAVASVGTPTKQPTPTKQAPVATPAPTAAMPIAGSFPYTFTGTGDSIVDVSAYADQPVLLGIIGNAASRHFAVQSYDADDNPVELLVNTTDLYLGSRPLNFSETPAAFLEIKAVGRWTIFVGEFAWADRVKKGVPFSGGNDNVLIVEGDVRLAEVTGNADSRHFAIQGYSSTSEQLLVNTTDPYAGTVRLDKGTLVFVITAVGDWTITTK